MAGASRLMSQPTGFMTTWLSVQSTSFAILLTALMLINACAGRSHTPPMSPSTAQESRGIIDTVPSSPTTRFDDSVMAAAAGQQIVVTPRGDTIQWLGGTMFNVDSTREFTAEYYAKNGSKYLRVALITGHSPDGKPIKVTKARVLLPPMTSDGELVLAGLCRIDSVRDPRVLAIATVREGETYGPARYAWRFDPVTQLLSGIPTANVTCAQVTGED
jgi:hypothetical protein